MSFIKKDVTFTEYAMQMYVYYKNIVNVPAIYKYDRKTKEMIMEKIGGMSVADYYGEDFGAVPYEVSDKIREIIRTLYTNGIVYPDITGYNFIEGVDKIWIIDFEHATPLANAGEEDHAFVLDFIGGYEGWNPDFA